MEQPGDRCTAKLKAAAAALTTDASKSKEKDSEEVEKEPEKGKHVAARKEKPVVDISKLVTREDKLATFRQLLEEAEVTSSMKWPEIEGLCSDDPRWGLLEEGDKLQTTTEYQNRRQIEEIKEEWLEARNAKHAFLMMLVSNFSIDGNTPWSEVKNMISSDPRYEAVTAERLREEIFMEFTEMWREMKREDQPKRLAAARKTFPDLVADVSCHGLAITHLTRCDVEMALADMAAKNPSLSILTDMERKRILAEHVMNLQREKREGEEIRRDNMKHSLHEAARAGRTDVVRELLKAGADVNQLGDDGETPLMMCVRDLPMVRLLLDAGALPNATDAYGHNALHYAGLNGSSAGVICSLFKAGCDPTARDINAETPADIARKMGKGVAARLLDRLAEEALKRIDKISVPDSDSKMSSAREAGGKGTQKEPETAILASIEKDDTVISHKPVDAASDSKVNMKEETEGRGMRQEPKMGVRESKGLDAPADFSKPVKPCAHCGAITHRKCSGCRVKYYCSRDCQCAAYLQHKKECGALNEKRVEGMEAKAQRTAARASLPPK